MLSSTMPYGDHYLSIDDLMSEIQLFFDELEAHFFGKTWFHQNLNQKFKRQLELTKKNITEDNFKEQISLLLTHTKSSLKETQDKYEKLYQDNLWFNAPFFIRGFVGVMTGVFIFPLVIAQLYPLSFSYKDVFFNSPPPVQTAKKCKDFNKEMKHYFKTILRTCNKTKKPISTLKMIWDSEQLRKKEWAYAKSHLIKGGQLSAEGEELRRAEHPELTHSFIVIGRRILSMAPKNFSLLDDDIKKDLINVKLAEDEYGGTWALKMKETSEHQSVQ